MFTHKEHAIHYIIRKGRVFPEDNRFFKKIWNGYIHGKPITTGQVALLDKLLHKYRNRLPENQPVDVVLTLPLRSPVIQTSTRYTTPKVFLSILDSGETIIKLTAPMKRNFNELVLKVTSWDPENRVYWCKFNTYALKTIINLVYRHFEDGELSPEISNLISQMPEVIGLYTSPTLVESSGNYYIAAITQPLYDLLDDLPELSKDPRTLLKLSSLGVNINKDITEHDALLKFVATQNVKVDINNINQAVQWLRLSGIKTAFIVPSRGMLVKDGIKQIVDSLNEQKITVIVNLSNITDPSTTVLIHWYAGMELIDVPVAKRIKIVNSSPIPIS